MPLSLEEIRTSAQNYFDKVKGLLNKYQLDYQPTSIGWKVKDIEEYNMALGGFLKDQLVTQCHIGFVDRRYIASIVFKEPIYKDVRILKLMQRRPQSTDPVGLDHMDFRVSDLKAFEAEIKAKDVPKWTHEANEVHGWISIWFDDTELKFNDHIVLDVGIKELEDTIIQLGFKPEPVN